ncbi:hypothetical protein VPH35_114236 [Triticum aestivum]
MRSPVSQFHSQQLLLPVILVLILAAAAEGQLPAARRGCRDKCGNMSVPFPFGIGPGCFRHGFKVLCNHSFHPPRAFLLDKRKSLKYVRQEYFSSSFLETWSPPLELMSISVATGEARAYALVSSLCSRNITGDNLYMVQHMDFSGTPFGVSATRNVLIGVGLAVEPELTYRPLNRGSYTDLSCRAQEVWSSLDATNGSCTGWGCCEIPFPPLGKTFRLSVKDDGYNPRWRTNPCNYGMLVERSRYNFSTLDMQGNWTLLKRFSRGVHLALDFAIGNTSCPAEGQPSPPDYACVSGNSSCANADAADTPAYVCKCWDKYTGNPYLPNGCQDIDECKQPQLYPCQNGRICKNRIGGYDCPCKFGMKSDGKAGTCTHVLLTTAAKATMGSILGILVMAVLFVVILHKEKKKTKEFYKKNGCPTLEKANVIKLFKKEELKPILKSSNLIGKGCFGEVYKGLLDNKNVAIKKPINGSVLESD